MQELKGMAIPTACFISALLLTFSFVVHAQLGFVSIDCGKPANYSMNDTRGIFYTSDAQYIDTGENHQISHSIGTEDLDRMLEDLRSFPEGKRNCYTLPVTKGNRYLVRAYFLYRNYDGLDGTPQFDVYLGTNRWVKVSMSSSSSQLVHEIITAAVGNSIQVCLVDTDSGKPFISALELRPFVNYTAYPVYSNQSLIPVAMINFGGQSKIRYPEDKYDRIWTPSLPPGSTTRGVRKFSSSIFAQTAATPTTGSTIDFDWAVDESRGPLYYHVWEHFAELQSLSANEFRIINFAENGERRIPEYSPKYLTPEAWWSSSAHPYSKLQFSFSKAPTSTLPPLINAMEIFELRFLEEGFTDITDVEAMLMIKSAYGLRRNWMGDPCSPKDFLWDGLRCDYAVKPQIEPDIEPISLRDLSSSGLTGTLPTSLGDLSQLQYLDLSSNNLSGDIPAFFAKLSNINFLNITCTGLNGIVPKAFQDRVAAKLLNVVAGPCMTASEPHPRKNKVEKIAIPVAVSVLLLLLVVGIIFWWKRHHKPIAVEPRPVELMRVEPKPTRESTSVVSTYQSEKCRLFRSEELERMTNNFTHLLGKGASCSVFLGHLEDGVPVAVKKLLISDPSIIQFKDEVDVLETINHKNLINLIGYCNEKRNLSLVYEFMPGGSLDDKLSVGKDDGKEALSWRDRVRIAYEAAEGLNYLHYSCRKPVIHRDLKPSNILLTADNEARIADFGFSKTMPTQGKSMQTTRVAGTPGYVDPEYARTGKPTEKSDVYSFGVILLELITCLPAIITNENCTLVCWVEKHSQPADLDKMVDRRLQGYNQDSIWAIVELALNCTRAVSLHRPTMTQVVAQLKDCLALEGGPSTHNGGV